MSVDAEFLGIGAHFTLLYLTALARSIRCGKSRSTSWGGVYGHFVMVADVTEVALIDHFHVVGLRRRPTSIVDDSSIRSNSVGNALHKTYAAAAAVADVVDALQLMVEFVFVPNSRSFRSIAWRVGAWSVPSAAMGCTPDFCSLREADLRR